MKLCEFPIDAYDGYVIIENSDDKIYTDDIFLTISQAQEYVSNELSRDLNNSHSFTICGFLPIRELRTKCIIETTDL